MKEKPPLYSKVVGKILAEVTELHFRYTCERIDFGKERIEYNSKSNKPNFKNLDLVIDYEIFR